MLIPLNVTLLFRAIIVVFLFQPIARKPLELTTERKFAILSGQVAQDGPGSYLTHNIA